MYRSFSNITNVSVVPPSSERPCVIDQTPCKSFNLGASGFPRSQIAQLAHASTMAEYEAIVRNMSMQAPQYNVKEGQNLESVFALIKPRSAQMPNELAAFAHALAQRDMERIDAAEVAQIEKELATPVVNPKTE